MTDDKKDKINSYFITLHLDGQLLFMRQAKALRPPAAQSKPHPLQWERRAPEATMRTAQRRSVSFVKISSVNQHGKQKLDADGLR